MGKASNRKKQNRQQAQSAGPVETKPQPKPNFWQQKWVKIGLIVFVVMALGFTTYYAIDWSGGETALNGSDENENDLGETVVNEEEEGETVVNEETEDRNDVTEQDGKESELMDKPVVTIEMESGGLIKIELEPGIAPNTVNNFISLVNDGFYDGLIFHRVIPGFMIQGGCPDGTGTGGPGYNIKGEFSSNDHENNLKHTRGVVSMARSNAPDSAGSQFFIVVDDSVHLDGAYAAFGRVIEGMDEADRIVSVSTGAADRPNEEQVIKKVTVDTFGIKYEAPEKMGS